MPRLLAALLILNFCGAGQAAEPATLVFAFNTAEPYKTLDAHGQPAGAYVELIKELASRSKLKLQIERCPLQRCLALLESGKADIAIGIKGSGERDSYLNFIDPPFAPASKVILLQRHDDPRQIRSYADLRPLRIGVVEGVKYFPQFDEDSSLQRDAALNVDSALRKLQARRFDVLIINERQARGELLASRQPGHYRRALWQIQVGEPRRIALSRQSPAARQFRQQLSGKLQTMLDDGSISRLLAPIDSRLADFPLQAPPARP